MPVPSIAALVPLLVILATDFWVYLDATTQSSQGTPVFLTYGTFRVDTPAAWFVCCLILWVVFFPLYLVARRR
jgi:hypothetical protein